MLVSAGCTGPSLSLHRQAVRSCSKQDPLRSCHIGVKNFCLSGGLPMLLAKVMKGKSSMTCIQISNGTMQLEVCHSTLAFHSFCHRGTELETIKQRITSPKGLSGSSLVFSPSFFLEHAVVLEPSYSFRICCFVYF